MAIRFAQTFDRTQGVHTAGSVLWNRDRGQFDHDEVCHQTLPGTEVDSAYSASLAYEKEIAAARDQNARNWRVDAHVERSEQGGATLQVEVRDNDGRPMSGLKFQGHFERPADKRADRAVALAETGIGIYRGNASLIAPGQWDLILQGDAAGRRVFLSRNRVLLN